MDPIVESLERRLARVEAAVLDARAQQPLSVSQFLLATVLTGGSLYMGIRGLGMPNHPYQWALGFLAITLAYHRGWLRRSSFGLAWLIAIADGVLLSVCLKIVIGSGIRHPLDWLRLPNLAMGKTSGKWFEVLPEWKLDWVATPITNLEIDFTILQTFLLLLTLIGALFRFQPFASLTAFLLILVSLPALSHFDWNWVFPALTLASLAFYAQSSLADRAHSL